MPAPDAGAFPDSASDPGTSKPESLEGADTPPETRSTESKHVAHEAEQAHEAPSGWFGWAVPIDLVEKGWTFKGAIR